MDYYGGFLVFDSDLSHHGILGMRWGQRNGPPYPLGSGDHSVSEKKAGWRKSLFGNKEQKKKKEKKGKVEVKKLQNEPEKGSEEYESKKIKALKQGKASEILQYKGDLTNQELQDAVNRIRLEQQLSEYSSKEVKSSWDKIDSTMNKVSKVNNWVTIGLNAATNADRVYKMLFPEDNKQQQNKQQNNQQKKA